VYGALSLAILRLLRVAPDLGCAFACKRKLNVRTANPGVPQDESTTADATAFAASSIIDRGCRVVRLEGDLDIATRDMA
jgi:hypothetical protein